MTYHIEDNKKTRLSTDYKYFNVCYTVYVAAYRCVDCYEKRKVHIVNNKGEKIDFKNHAKYVETVELKKNTSGTKKAAAKSKSKASEVKMSVKSATPIAPVCYPIKDRNRSYAEGRKGTVKPAKAKTAKAYNLSY